MSRSVVVLGTGPEAIKLASVTPQLRSRSGCEAFVCVTARQREMPGHALEFFDIRPGIDLNLMRPNLRLAAFAGRAVPQLDEDWDVRGMSGARTIFSEEKAAGHIVRQSRASVQSGLGPAFRVGGAA